MAIFDNLIYHTAVDTVAIFNEKREQLFVNARPMRAEVRPEIRLMDHPIETGSMITDHRILLPIEIQIAMVLDSSDYLDTYRALRQYWENSTLLIVQTKGGVYRNQVICAIPSLEDPDLYDTLQIAFSTRQIQFANSKSINKPENPTNGDTVDRGFIQPTQNMPAAGSAQHAAAGAAFR